MPLARAKLNGMFQHCEINVDARQHRFEWNNENLDASEAKWEAPVEGSIYGTLLNFKGALAEMGGKVLNPPYKQPPKAPILYIKTGNTIIGANSTIPMPHDEGKLQVGATVGIVIGKTATRVPEKEAISYVEGYTIVNDISIPHESIYRPPIKYNCRDGFCPVGPWVVKREELDNPDFLTIKVYVNGELVQENTTANLIRPISRLIADVTEFMTLNKGDVLLVGIPEDAPLVKAGDCVRIEVERIGILENTILKDKG
ncbi:fumarylacetoacetate hydrolase family protein [Falsibacillus albus]|uniref:4-hydroxyphenylacetate isomerase n=1 Tax=Falsibacillus albus TaxID=2478915 RepID=A0A3L7K548_9BACI|nr:fumarylacetoacetate hydrolase family protein [Falsibacillus albus]RLQ97384.1 4-hydroxyphenylacetate isomerase [Falsibacillus albus]